MLTVSGIKRTFVVALQEFASQYKIGLPLVGGHSF